MTTATLDDVTARRKKPEPSAEKQAAGEFVRLAREQGPSLTGPDGLLKQLTKAGPGGGVAGGDDRAPRLREAFLTPNSQANQIGTELRHGVRNPAILLVGLPRPLLKSSWRVPTAVAGPRC